MGERENKRVLQTRQRLQVAMLKMLKSTPIHAVSIRALCGEAGINRTTFYNHYGSQYDLLEDVGRRFLDSIALRLEGEADSRESVHRRVGKVLAYIEENRELAVLLLNNNIDPSFAERIFTLPRIMDLLSHALAGCRSEQEREATVSFVIHGSYRLLLDWINREERLPAQEQAELMLSLAQKVCPGAD